MAALAAAPSRLAVWALSGAQGGGLAPLGTGAAALGAALLAGGALSGAPAPPGDEPAATVASLAPVQVAEPPSPRERSSSEPAGRPRAVAHRGLGPPAVRRDRPAPGPDRISAGNPPSAPPGGGGSSSVGVPDSPPSTGSAATSGAGVPSVADVVEVPEPEAVPALPALPKVPVQIQVQVPLPQPSLPKLP